jgi:hypothetical protein
MSTPWYRKVLFVTLPVVVFPTGAVAVLVYVLTHQLDRFDARPFDPATWANADNKQRAAMSRDAIRHLPAGLPEAEIELLLGKGEVEETQRLIGRRPRGAVRTYVYYLGCWSGTYYDSTFLWVHVGEDGRVTEAVIGGG